VTAAGTGSFLFVRLTQDVESTAISPGGITATELEVGSRIPAAESGKRFVKKQISSVELTLRRIGRSE
jgi:hypothetical protein